MPPFLLSAQLDSEVMLCRSYRSSLLEESRNTSCTRGRAHLVPVPASGMRPEHLDQVVESTYRSMTRDSVSRTPCSGRREHCGIRSWDQAL